MKLSYIACIAFTCFLFGCRTDCSYDNVKQIMGTWYKQKIQFPDNIHLINKNTTPTGDTNHIVLKDSKYYVIHFFTADCDECINALLMAQKFISKHKDVCNVKYIFIASGPTAYYAENAIHKAGFSYPVYFEKDYYSFKKKNALPVSDKMYDTMLVNEQGEVLLFGGFFLNEKAEKLFSDIVKCESCS